jgi:hypothetical protein
MNRVQYLKQALEINEIQADLLSEQISDIPDDKLKDFLIFRMNYVQPMMSKELITKTALFDYKKKMIEVQLQNGVKVFKDIYEVKDFLLTFYKGKEIANGAGNYYDFVVIAMDKDGELINKYVQNEHGTYKKLNNDETGTVLKWLYANQNRIGVVEYIAYFDPFRADDKQLENSQAAKLLELTKDEEIDPRINSMVGAMANKVRVSA